MKKTSLKTAEIVLDDAVAVLHSSAPQACVYAASPAAVLNAIEGVSIDRINKMRVNG